MVEVKNVSKQYGGKVVLEETSVTIQKGKITSFIGPNGAGKSTLLSIMSRLIKKDSGEIFIDGEEIGTCDSKELAKKMSILKQANQINIRLTIKDLVSFGRFPYSQGRLTEEDWVHINQALSYMKLEEIQDKYLDQLSGGQCQRAFIAMVIAQDTDYIFLDEPLNNLDMKHSVEIMKLLKRLVEELGKTIVIVIHDINFASVYSDYIVALKNGRIVKEGPPEEIIETSVLEEIYDMTIPIQTIDNQRIGVYFS
ncbi:petrobactin ABC transporter ATP-binding protein YclP [Bacillus mojavensis]|jgi:iron complex transport system ATP-binding protein|uniref:Petrobactin ABC transporter ATP-binding protein YclP n=1 Tax=Bacillus mojavensis TaxID=72360 RepID=A0AAP3CPI9_BACMO|nr:petrobactin ABC transporter ATP-binding protein YclP [Bacillus mojavensis]MCY8105532.1 petrobactin ABC transporter ATP-binding protein YclP [Bacillus mojavensis]MCY8481944.1 petrobactin ABC transporter ATP-binding protein YclP [Bacillus mojavensis]MCY8508190.1 petrobactin ABC transporter ATP-binding protein YclP [Bacillus mojavensis]MEC1679303.1 petrobactin ABC transporter ATP-binding protein YclP [Bacillus mojavensis]MEC1711281.1 petrobactin ABC transporter ATP-binding protein YclP [Bacill